MKKNNNKSSSRKRLGYKTGLGLGNLARKMGLKKTPKNL